MQNIVCYSSSHCSISIAIVIVSASWCGNWTPQDKMKGYIATKAVHKLGYVTIKSERVQIMTSVVHVRGRDMLGLGKLCVLPDSVETLPAYCYSLRRSPGPEIRTSKSIVCFLFCISEVHVIILLQKGTTCWDTFLMRLHLSEDSCETSSHPKHINGAVFIELEVP